MKKILFLMICVFSFLLFGCGENEKLTNKAKDVVASTYYTVLDDTGSRLYFKNKPQRIVSLTYGTDEILTDLVDSKRIVAYSKYAGDSGISFLTKEQVYKVGRKVHNDLETIVVLKPDLVVCSTSTDRIFVEAMKRVGLNVYLARSPHSYEEMCQKVQNLALAVGEGERGKAIVKRMNDDLDSLNARLGRLADSERKTVMAFSFSSVVGRRGNLFDNMMQMAHVINGAAVATPAGTGEAIVSKEMVLEVNPDIFLLPTWDFDGRKDVNGYAQSIVNDPAYKNVKAVKNKQVKFLPDKYKYVASHHIVEAVEKIARIVYPEVFSK